MIQLYFLEYKKLELVDNYQNTAFENKLRLLLIKISVHSRKIYMHTL